MNVLLYGVIVLLWGSTWIGIKLQLGSVDPAVSVAYRYILAAVCLFVWVGIRRLPMRFGLGAHLRFAAVGLLMYSTNYVLFYYCSTYLVSGLVSIIFCLSVVFNIVNGYLFLKRPISLPVVVAALVGLVGLSLVFGDQILGAGSSHGTLLGVLLGLGATLLFSFGNIVSSKNQQLGLPVVQGTAWSMAYGALFTTLGCLVLGAHFSVEPSLRYLAGLLYLAVFGSAVAFVAYLTLLGKIGPDRAAYATVAFPLVSLTLSTIFEHYHWTPLGLFGVVLVLAANAVILSGRKPRPGAATPAAEPEPAGEQAG